MRFQVGCVDELPDGICGRISEWICGLKILFERSCLHVIRLSD